MYNGQFGIENDGDGLYYMRTRFYNVDLKKFMNRDVVMGNIQDSQSLNRYAYVNGNPVNFTDPFGMARETVENTQAQTMSGLDKLQLGLDVAGLIPVYGEIADGVNVVVYVFRGQYKNAGLSFVAMVPVFGVAATGGKVYSKISGKLDTIFDKTKKVLSNHKGYIQPYGFFKKLAPDSKTVQYGEKKILKHREKVANGVNVPKHSKELLVGRYGDLKKPPISEIGDGLEGHHMISKRFLEKHGIHEDDGVALNMERLRHQATPTHGASVNRIPEYYNLSPRDALRYDIQQVRRIYRDAGFDRKEVNNAVREVIQQWDNHSSQLMKK